MKIVHLVSWQRERLAWLRSVPRFAAPVRGVTALAYVWGTPEFLDREFWRFECAYLQTFEMCGKLPAVLVTNYATATMRAFADRYGIKIQLEPALIPGNIESMSIDCVSRLHGRFRTEYVLIIQNDGFPLRSGLEKFVGAGYDFYGAPFCRSSFLPDLLTRILRYHPMNGGFSLRSRRCCAIVSDYWHRYYENGYPERLLEDDFYTRYLPSHHWLTLLKSRPAPSRLAAEFSFDASFPFDRRRSIPFGFHNAKAFAELAAARPEEFISLA